MTKEYCGGPKCGHTDYELKIDHSHNGCVLCENERLRTDISQAYDLRDKAEGRYCTALGEIERLQRDLRNACASIGGLSAAVTPALEPGAQHITERDYTDAAMHAGLPPPTQRDMQAMNAVIDALYENRKLPASREARNEYPECRDEPRDCPYVYCHSTLKCARVPPTATPGERGANWSGDDYAGKSAAPPAKPFADEEGPALPSAKSGDVG